jgi:hypothetical protein
MLHMSEVRAAALIAPVVDRVFTSAMGAARDEGGRELVRRFGGPPAVGCLIEYRTRLAVPGGRVDPLGFAAVGRYWDPAERERALDAPAAAGMIELGADGAFAATPLGQKFLGELWGLHDRLLAARWAQHADRVERLLEPMGRLVAHGAQSGGRAFATMAPPFEPAGSGAGTRLLNLLGTWRYHRADAHALAWRVAGHTAASIQQLGPGPERIRIEDETDRLNGRGYAVLDPRQRAELIADLGALP